MYNSCLEIIADYKLSCSPVVNYMYIFSQIEQQSMKAPFKNFTVKILNMEYFKVF